MITFDEAFFEGETRGGFYIAPMMKKAWAASMEVLGEIDRICRKHGITYFADWGTLLGAVRHRGFVPWDDDIDITMKSPDYQKFLEVAPQELQAPFEVINFHTDAEWTDMLSRVINGRHIQVGEEHLKQFHGCPYLVGIDIFPLDYVSRNPEEDKMQLDLVSIVLEAVGVVQGYNAGECTLEEMVRFLAKIEELCGIRFDVQKPLDQQLRVLGDQLCMIYQEEDADEIGIVVSRIVNRPNYHMPKEYYEKVIEMPFENITVPVPVGYDEVLKLKYGQNYMTPYRAGCGHDYPFYADQEKILAEHLKQWGMSGEPFGIVLED